MFFSNSVVISAMLSLGSTLGAPNANAGKFCQPRNASQKSQAELWKAYVEAFYIKQNVPEAFKYIESGYIQHNAYSVGQGAASSEHQIEGVWPEATVMLLHNTYSNGFGWAHSVVQGGPMFPNATAILDIYRYDGACIVEHWDSIQSRNGNTVNPAFPN